MRETGHTIREWALETFGEWDSHGDIYDRAAEELAEFEDQLFGGGSPESVAEEIADLIIVLSQLPAKYGIDVFETVDEKMALNRRRKWRTSGDGFGQHVEEE